MITEKELDKKYAIPDDVKDFYNEGITTRDKGENVAALDIFLRVLKEHPDTQNY